MEREDKLEMLLAESRREYIQGLQEEIKDIAITLLKYCSNRGMDEKNELIRFFHSIKGTGATLNLKEISVIAKEYEVSLENIDQHNSKSNETILMLLNGLARINNEVERLHQKYLIGRKEQANLELKENHNTQVSPSILAVGDDITMLDLLERALHKEGCRVHITSNLLEMKQIVKEEQIDLIVMDSMLEKSGFNVLEQIRAERSDVPIIFLTSNSSEEEKVTALNIEVDDYITKPFQMKELLARVWYRLGAVNPGEQHTIHHRPKAENITCSEGKNPKENSMKHVLVVDDVSVIVTLLTQRLTHIGYQVSSAVNGEQAVLRSKLLKPDLMVVDLMLPELDGFEVCRQVKNNQETKDTKIIVLTSRGSKNDVLKCFELGVNDYMIKPFSLTDLENRVKGLLPL